MRLTRASASARARREAAERERWPASGKSNHLAAVMLAMTISGTAQQPLPQAPPGPGWSRGGGGRGGVGPALFTVADGNKDGAVSRDELKGTFDKWYTAADTANAGSVTPAQLATAVTAALPAAAPAPQAQGDPCGGRSSNPQVPCPADVEKMKAALPAQGAREAGEAAQDPRARPCAGFVHSSIPLAAATVDEMGKKTGAWTTTITYDPADINTENLKQYDVAVPRQHDGLLPRRSERQGSHRRAARGAARVHSQRQRHRRHPRRVRLVPRYVLRSGGTTGGAAAPAWRRVDAARRRARRSSARDLRCTATPTRIRS